MVNDSRRKSNVGLKIGPKKAMVLAAGLGRRLRPITANLPKPLVKLANRTLLDYSLDHLVAAGVECAVINTHYLGDQIKQHLSSRNDLEIIISSEEINFRLISKSFFLWSSRILVVSIDNSSSNSLEN